MSPSKEALDAIRRQLYDEGISVTDWARANGFDLHLVYGVLSGRSRASRGESHRIAVALGLKPKPIGQREIAGGSQLAASRGV